MSFAWLVECKTCRQRFVIGPREVVPGAKIERIDPPQSLGEIECPHCHEVHDYTTEDRIPGEAKSRR